MFFRSNMAEPEADRRFRHDTGQPAKRVGKRAVKIKYDQFVGPGSVRDLHIGKV